MKSLLEKVNELEQRIILLEDELQKLQSLQKSETKAIRQEHVVTVSKPIRSETTNEETFEKGGFNYVGEFSSQRHSMDLSASVPVQAQEDVKSKKKKTRYNETVVGKYLAGALASLLIFIGAASFVSIIWNDISDVIKFLIILGAGVLLSAAGYYLLIKAPPERTPNSTIGSIVFSTGSGLVYLALMAGSVAFGLFHHYVSMGLCLIWSILILLSYRKTNRFLSVVIAFLGTGVNLTLAADFSLSQGEYALLLAMVSAVVLVGLFITRKNRNGTFEVTILMAGVLFIVFVGNLNEMSDQITFFELSGLTALLLLKNLLFYNTEKNDDGERGKRLFFGLGFRHDIMPILMLIQLVLTMINLRFFRRMDDLPAQSIFFGIFTVQFILNAIFYPKVSRTLNLVYSVGVFVTTWRITQLQLYVGSGAFMVFVLFLLSEKWWKNTYNKPFLAALVFIDTLGLFMAPGTHAYLFAIFNLVIMIYLVKHEADRRRLLFENLMLFVFLMNSFSIARAAVNLFSHINANDVADFRFTLFHIIALVLIILAIQLKLITSRDRVSYSKNVEEQAEEVLQKGESRISFSTRFSKSLFSELQFNFDNLGVYLYLLFLYFSGISRMQEMFSAGLKFSLALSTLFVMLMQSYMIVKNQEKISNLAGGWMVVKYLLYTWAVMRAFLRLPAESLAYSIVGLVIAVISIYLGFRIKVSSIRQFGLALTILMVAKYLFVDLSGENSITRVGAFIVGGVLCFAVSVIYNKLSKDQT